MANNKKAVYGTGAGGWFQNKGEKDLHHLHTFKAVPNYDKETEYKYFKANAVNMPNELNEDPSKIIGHVQLYHQSSYTPKRALFPCWTTCVQFV
jgi:hypothetical protein